MPKRKCSFTDELLKSFPAFRSGRDKWEVLCTVCKAGTYVSVSNDASVSEKPCSGNPVNLDRHHTDLGRPHGVREA
ncbi:hypothetical protein JOB18_034115 [Solea senegalensis]|uniref:Uncharacterized protein n=1 Tax=Solea senegalensis TaxID=28829 RepID=A0AAV6T995_SOLSE|nr:hypothetical protein JOB18_034115 [Solea senegalensis]